MEHVQNIDRAEIILNINSELDLDVQNEVIQFMYRLEKKEPIQYIIGQTIFAGIPINLNRHVIIPRPETESLVCWIKNRARRSSHFRYLLGGCIALPMKIISMQGLPLGIFQTKL